MRCATYNVAACLFSILDEMFHEETWTFCPVAWEASCNGTGISVHKDNVLEWGEGGGRENALEMLFSL